MWFRPQSGGRRLTIVLFHRKVTSPVYSSAERYDVGVCRSTSRCSATRTKFQIPIVMFRLYAVLISVWWKLRAALRHVLAWVLYSVDVCCCAIWRGYVEYALLINLIFVYYRFFCWLVVSERRAQHQITWYLLTPLIFRVKESHLWENWGK